MVSILKLNNFLWVVVVYLFIMQPVLSDSWTIDIYEQVLLNESKLYSLSSVVQMILMSHIFN